MYLKRLIDSDLLKWSKEEDRRTLLLRGARQIGKSSSVKKLAENFEHFIEINFEKDAVVHNHFGGNLDVKDICNQISILYKKPIIPNKTLLFFDEIQECPRAITALRYFYEDYPELHVVAAGSLLEFALEDLPSFGVGRISSMYMYPFSFQEFMLACGEERLWEEICRSSPEKPLFPTFHNMALELLKKFLVVGGMPAVVSEYVKNRDMLATQKKLNVLMDSLKSDFSKYKKRVPELRIARAFQAVVEQAGSKFMYSKIESYNARQIKESIGLLENAGLVISVVHTSANGIPLGAQANYRKQKFLLLDTGIFQRLLGLELSDILFSSDFSLVNRGFIAEQFVGLELLKSASCYEQKQLHYWAREKSQSSAEVDYVIQKSEKIIPIEVKSGTSGKMQSMNIFLEEKQSEYGIRTSLENFAQYDKIKVYPLYAIGNLISSAGASSMSLS
ncbi:MAG: AAA family ATPase [Bacteroidales bacterium]|nr:AAA family ATPase [Bacteroidales bacterium]